MGRYTVRAEIPEMSAEQSDALGSSLQMRPAITSAHCSPASRLPAGGRPPRCEVTLTAEVPGLVQAVLEAADGLEGHDLLALEVMGAEEFTDRGQRWPDVWNSQQVAEILQVSLSRLRQMRASGLIKGHQLTGREMIYDPREVVALAAARDAGRQ